MINIIREYGPHLGLGQNQKICQMGREGEILSFWLVLLLSIIALKYGNAREWTRSAYQFKNCNEARNTFNNK